MTSSDWLHVGSWTVTLQVKLLNYTGVTAVTKKFTLIVLDPCLVTTITPDTLSEMTVYVQDTIAQTQTFWPFKDSIATLHANPVFCGEKSYTVSSPITIIVPPVSGLVNIDPWTISAMTGNKTLVGLIEVTFTVKLFSVKYSTVPELTIKFNLIIVDVCRTATLNFGT